MDGDTGLYYYGARYYDPFIGRFISADTAVQDPYDTQSYGRYTYCRDNPIIYNDPSGHFWLIDDLIASAVSTVVSTIVNSINNGAFTPTLSLWVCGACASYAYNTSNGSSTVSAGYGFQLGGNITLGVSASATFDKNGQFQSGSLGVGLQVGSGVSGGVGASVGWGRNGVYTGVTINCNVGFNNNGGYYNYGGGINGSCTISANGTTSWSAGGGANGGFAGYTMALGMNYSSVPNEAGNNYSMTGSGGFDRKQADAFDDHVASVNYMKTYNKYNTPTNAVPDSMTHFGESRLRNYLYVNSIITGNDDGYGKFGKGMKGVEEVTYIDDQGNRTDKTIKGVRWLAEATHAAGYDEPTNEGMFAVEFDPKRTENWQMHVVTPEDGVFIHGTTISSGCVVTGNKDIFLGSIRNGAAMGSLSVVLSIDDQRPQPMIDQRPIYPNRNK